MEAVLLGSVVNTIGYSLALANARQVTMTGYLVKERWAGRGHGGEDIIRVVRIFTTV